MKGRNAIYGYLFISPLILGFLMFFLRPLIESVQMSFSNVVLQAGQGGFILEPIGWANFEDALTLDPHFNRYFTEELSQMLVDIPAILVFSFL